MRISNILCRFLLRSFRSLGMGDQNLKLELRKDPCLLDDSSRSFPYDKFRARLFTGGRATHQPIWWWWRGLWTQLDHRPPHEGEVFWLPELRVAWHYFLVPEICIIFLYCIHFSHVTWCICMWITFRHVSALYILLFMYLYWLLFFLHMRHINAVSSVLYPLIKL